MRLSRKPFVFATLISLTVICGCADISLREMRQSDETFNLNSSSVYGEELSGMNFETTDNDIIEGNEIDYSEAYSTYTFSVEDEKFISSLVFVGDSICMGLSSYGVLSQPQVIAQGSVAARNIMEFKFTDADSSGEYDVLTALVNASSDYIILSMGMNDLNITDEETFCNNYLQLISMIKNYLPDSEITVLSITPVCGSSEFTDNETINTYNRALKSAIGGLEDDLVNYLDIGPELKNSAGELKTNYTSGDGLHLTKTAYYAVLRQICDFGIR